MDFAATTRDSFIYWQSSNFLFVAQMVTFHLATPVATARIHIKDNVKYYQKCI